MEFTGSEDRQNRANFLEILSPADRRSFEELKTKVGSPENRYNRNKRLATFNEIIESIKSFCIRNDGDDWKRCIVCGICWIGKRDLAINTRQLRVLIAKSKSTINGALSKMGYETVPTKGSNAEDLVQTIPFLKKQYNEMRQWTIRRMNKVEAPVESIEPICKEKIEIAIDDISLSPIPFDILSTPEPDLSYDLSINDQDIDLDLSLEFPLIQQNMEPDMKGPDKNFRQISDSVFNLAM